MAPPLRKQGKVVPEDGRRHNRTLILRSLFHDGPVSRADLARAIHLTRATIGDLVGELIAEGLVQELGVREEKREGKPATLVGIVPKARYVIALDVSLDLFFRGALVDLEGTPQVLRSVERRGRTGEEAVELAIDLGRELSGLAEGPVMGIGVASPGVVDSAGVVQEAPNLGWKDLPLAQRLHESLRLPVQVANDANAAVLGEFTFGKTSDPSTVLVKISQGVGAGVIVDGHLIVGDRFAAGEIGHIVVDDRGQPCACGRTGCLETIIAAPRLRQVLQNPNTTASNRALAAAGRRLGIALAPIISALNLREITVSCPHDVVNETFLQSALDTIQRRTMPAVGNNVDLRFTSLGEDDALLGAAVLVLDREFGIV